MVGFSFPNINQNSEINFYRFDNNLVDIIIISIIILLKIDNFEKRREEKRNYYFPKRRTRINVFPCYENFFFQDKNISNMNIIIKDKKNLDNIYIKIKENQIKKRKNINNNNNSITSKYKIITVFIIINIFCQIKNYIFNLFYS